ncbi:MAG: UDP-N-acetylmuramoyl-L-alanine--D-glutamate ligase [Candidatus Doudnabacteria bacterium]|nr:UDP-N-acetylmuramoyl-L-alanine--D-glutamate ligase [Candidatus Doudnabacteria bacterium]
MEIKDLKDKLVAVLGFGLEGQATTKYLLKHGVKPVLFDERPLESFEAGEQDFIKAENLNFIFGPQAFLELKGFDVVFRSPGIKLSEIQDKVSTKTVITSQTKYFFEHCPAKIIGVTGTKGKGTTASLIFEILQATSYKLPPSVYLTGNIGNVQPLEILDELKKEDVVVYELSSFQLQDLTQSPHIGVCLMVTSEHLDYHKSVEEYWQAKSAITRFQTKNNFTVVNVDYEGSKYIGSLGEGIKIFVSTKQVLQEGVCLDGEKIKAVFGSLNLSIPLPVVRLRGRHNLENILASIAACLALGYEVQSILETVKNFNGLEHRLEFVGEKNGVKYYNDSFSTTPDTAIAALESFSEKIVVILGGSSKKSNFAVLGEKLNTANNIRGVVLVGDEGSNIKAQIKNSAIQILEGAKNMAEIVKQANSLAESGDVVLLSPACVSFGMFKNYKDRGEQFKYQISNNK